MRTPIRFLTALFVPCFIAGAPSAQEDSPEPPPEREAAAETESAPDTQSAPETETAAETEPAPEPPGAEDERGAAERRGSADDGGFIPTEELGADEEVTFPVDI